MSCCRTIWQLSRHLRAFSSSSVKTFRHLAPLYMPASGSSKKEAVPHRLSEYLEKRKDLYRRMEEERQGGKTIIAWYDQAASIYDEQFENAGFDYPQLIAETVNSLVKDKDARILDIGAGSGKVGLKLQGFGFNNVDGLDGSSAMLKIAREKKIYHEYLCCMVGKEKIPEVSDAWYDVVCAGGAISAGHLTFDAIPTMLRAVKPYGYLVFNHQDWSAQFDEYSDDKLDACFSKLKHSGMCSHLEKKECELRPGERSHIFTLKRGEGVPV